VYLWYNIGTPIKLKEGMKMNTEKTIQEHEAEFHADEGKKANGQTRATKKWEEKTGRVAKTYKLNKSVVEEFAEACEENEVSQAETLMQLMSAYASGSVYYSKKKKKASIFLPE